MKASEVLTKEFLEEELKVKTKSEIKRETGFALTTINNYIKKYGLIIDVKLEAFNRKYVGRTIRGMTILQACGIKNNHRLVLCKCECGIEKVLQVRKLLCGDVSSCGCRKLIKLRQNGYKDISYAYFSQVKSSAVRRGLDFDITMSDIWDMYLSQNMKCYYSGVDIIFVPTTTKRYLQTASIDRIDNDKGYNIDNICIVHKRVNIIKGNMSLEELKYWIYNLNNTLKPTDSKVDHKSFVGNDLTKGDGKHE